MFSKPVSRRTSAAFGLGETWKVIVPTAEGAALPRSAAESGAR
jgi:hypothetical protein